MEWLIAKIVTYAPIAHWIIFACILLTGLNIPFSIDVFIIAAATLATTVVPENTYHLFFCILLGCYCAAIISYWMGRLLGPKLFKVRFLSKILSPERMQKVNRFFEKYGAWALIIGRFIPFGVRNALFMSSGMSRMPFGKFLLIDAIGCTLWCIKTFLLFYFLGHYYETLIAIFKTSFLYLIPAAILGGLGYFFYRKWKRSKHKDEDILTTEDTENTEATSSQEKEL